MTDARFRSIRDIWRSIMRRKSQVTPDIDQSDTTASYDLDIADVWEDYTGRGVRVAVYDEGIEGSQPDLNDGATKDAATDAADSVNVSISRQAGENFAAAPATDPAFAGFADTGTTGSSSGWAPRAIALQQAQRSGQWYLDNTEPGLDLNVADVWLDYTGQGVTVAVYDNGVDGTHSDLDGNFANWDATLGLSGAPTPAASPAIITAPPSPASSRRKTTSWGQLASPTMRP
jgi:subtilisin family serine protease